MSYAIYVIDVYGASVGASATATVAMVRSLLGAAFPLFTIQSRSPLSSFFLSVYYFRKFLSFASVRVSGNCLGDKPTCIYCPRTHARSVDSLSIWPSN